MSNERFRIGQIVTLPYPDGFVGWCNREQIAHPEEIEPDPETGERRFRIVENVPYEPTEEELTEMQAAAEKAKAENASKLAAMRKMGLTDTEALAVMAIMPFWDEGEDYQTGDYVVFNLSKLYRCEKGHRSSDESVPGNSLGYWHEVD